MKVPVVNQCCCGCTLKTGTLIIGWLDLILSAIMVIFSIIGIVTNAQTSNQHGGTSPKAIFAIYIIGGLFHILISVMLLIGANRRLPKYLQYWIIIATVSLVLNLFSSVGYGIVAAINVSAGTGISMIIGGLIGTAILAYLIIVVYNFKREMISENQHV